jgi:hypothetical protein
MRNSCLLERSELFIRPQILELVDEVSGLATSTQWRVEDIELECICQGKGPRLVGVVNFCPAKQLPGRSPQNFQKDALTVRVIIGWA